MSPALRVLRPFDPWRSPLCTCPFKYSLNPYTGCSFRCAYCYATSYVGVRDSTPKKNFIKNLLHDIRMLQPGFLVNIGTSSDPYPPEERTYRLTRRALRLLIRVGARILVTTKGTIVAEDASLMVKGNVAVTPTITMLDESLARSVETRAPAPRKRIEALRVLSRSGVPVGVRIDPIIPYVNDDPYEIEELVCTLAQAGSRFVVTSTYKARPDNLARMREALSEIGERLYKLYIEKGVWIRGYRYLPTDMRRNLLRPVIDSARKCGLEYATCREGFVSRDWFNARSCDGSHLIPLRVKPVKPASLEGWLSDASE